MASETSRTSFNVLAETCLQNYTAILIFDLVVVGLGLASVQHPALRIFFTLLSGRAGATVPPSATPLTGGQGENIAALAIMTLLSSRAGSVKRDSTDRAHSNGLMAECMFSPSQCGGPFGHQIFGTFLIPWIEAKQIGF